VCDDDVSGPIGLVLDDLGRHDEAVADLQRDLEIVGKVYGKQHPNYANALSNVSVLAYARHDLQKAFELAQQAHAIRLAALGPDHPEVAMSWSNLGSVLRGLHRLPEARDDLENAIAIKQRVLGADNPSVAITHLTLSQVLTDLHDAPGALDHAQRAAAIFHRSLGDAHLHTAQAQAQLGVGLGDMQRCGEAVTAFESALPGLAGDSALGRFEFDLADALRHVHGDPRRIAELVGKARAAAAANKDQQLFDGIAKTFGR
jgi:serine/threonine-protein kinase